MSLDIGLEMWIIDLTEKYIICRHRMACARVTIEACMCVNSEEFWDKWTLDMLHLEQQQILKLLPMFQNIFYIQGLLRLLSKNYDYRLYDSPAMQTNLGLPHTCRHTSSHL